MLTTWSQTALLEVRVLPWRPRARVMSPETLREAADPTVIGFDDLSGVVIGLALWLVIIIAAPVVVLLLAVGLFSVELPVVVMLAGLLLVARFAGLLPWTVVVLDAVTGGERRETYRNLLRALRRIRELNADRRVAVRWAWT